MCVYVCVYCHPQTDCFIVSQLFIVVRYVDGKPPNSALDLVSYRSASKRLTSARKL